MKEKYLLSIKNAMFWHFSSSEIRETVGDLNMYFDSALQDGASEREVMEKYGEPKTFVREIRNQPDFMERKRKTAVSAKIAFLLFIALGMLLSFDACQSAISSLFFVIFSSLFIWSLADNTCVLEIVAMTEKKKRFFWNSQIVIGVLFVILQFGAYIVLPRFMRDGLIPLHYVGLLLRVVIYSCLFLLGVATVIFIKEMLNGNVYLFFCTVQSISLIFGLIMYYDFLKRMVDIGDVRFIFSSYLFCVPVLLAYAVYMQKYKKDVRG